MTEPVVFISYSEEDEKEKEALLSQLGVLRGAGLIDLWSNDRIGAGAEWEAEIRQAIGRARVAVLLITANFLTSDFILGQVVPSLLQRRKDEGLVVFPVIARACPWQAVDWLAKMEVRPRGGTPVWSGGGSHVDEDLAAIAEEIALIVNEGQIDSTLSTRLGFTRLPFEPETILIPAGPFLMGSNQHQADEAPQHELDLPAFRISKYPITNREYAEFIKRERQHQPPTKPRWFLREPPPDRLDHPVTGVSWHDAQAFCKWLTGQTGGSRVYRLPTEAEWEKAARGPDGRQFPWGNTWAEGRCNAGSSQTTPVVDSDGQPNYPQGASPYGCLDMLGNVQEWTSTLWGSDLKNNAFPYPYRANDGREDPQAEQHLHRVYRVYRGGSFRDDADRLRCSARGAASADSAIRWRGFRVVLEMSQGAE